MHSNKLKYLNKRGARVGSVALYLALAFALGSMSFSAAKAEGETELSEQKKIEMLIASVEDSGGTFVRNGSEHSATAAAAHMRMKLSRAGGAIRTAQQFIKYIATKSSITGIAYRIKLPDGSEHKSADWLRARLAEIESQANAASEDCCTISP